MESTQNDFSQEAPSTEGATPWYKKRYILVFAVVLLGIIISAGSFVAWSFFFNQKVSLENAKESFDQNDYNLAIVQADAVLAKDPNNISALTAKSIFLSQKGSLEFKEIEYGTQALSFADKAIQVDENNSEAWRARAYAFEIMQKYKEAHASYEKAIVLDGKNSLAVFGNAHTYDLEGNSVEAENGYHAAIALDPGLVVAYAGLGRSLSARGENDAALAEFMKAIELTTNAHQQAEIAHSIAMIKKAQGDLDGARVFAEEATTIDPTYPLGWYGLGSILFKQATLTSVPITPNDRANLLRASNQALNKAIALNPNQTLAYLDLASGFAFATKSNVALEILTKAEEVVFQDITLSASQKEEVKKEISALRAEIQKLGKKVPNES